MLADLEAVIDTPSIWLDTPNALFGGRIPGDLIGTKDESLVREWIESVKLGMFS